MSSSEAKKRVVSLAAAHVAHDSASVTSPISIDYRSQSLIGRHKARTGNLCQAPPRALLGVLALLLALAATWLSHPEPPPVITKFTNGYLLRDGQLVPGDLWVSSKTGRIISPQSAFYAGHLRPDRVVDLEGKILSPGFIDVQLNGGNGFDFSIPEPDFEAKCADTNRRFVKTGVTSYLPTVISQAGDVYKQVLPYLGPSGKDRDPSKGAESLGAHVEGPFLSPARNGIHNKSILQQANSWSDIVACYSEDGLKNIRKITAAPEEGKMTELIPEFVKRGIVFSIGHTDADLAQAEAAIDAGATMVTHMFNAMRPFAHREPGVFGLLGESTFAPPSPVQSPVSSPSKTTSIGSNVPNSAATTELEKLNRPKLSTPNHGKRPFFGLISDGIHLSGPALKIAYSAFPAGAILVTDALKFAGLPDGKYEWTNGDEIIKEGLVIKHAHNGRLAGVASSLIECINNFRRFTSCGTAAALECVTSHPARMLGEGVADRKGLLVPNMDADLVVLSGSGDQDLVVEQVWKFGVQVA
ncbi:hypothetical protein DV738_g4781, partial [Chaetothyriales sp. CBS 135597]